MTKRSREVEELKGVKSSSVNSLDTITLMNMLDNFLNLYLIDNAMDPILQQINRLFVKLNNCSDTVELNEKEEINNSMSKKMKKRKILQSKCARKLMELFKLAVNQLQNHQASLHETYSILQENIHEFENVRYCKRRRSDEAPKIELSEKHFNLKNILPKGTHVAAKIARSHELWILASIVKHDPKNNCYEVEDEDSGDEADSSGHRHHIVPFASVIGLPSEHSNRDKSQWTKYSINQRVMAMYPNTTSFYLATVVVPNPKGSLYVIVQFDDDADETGIVPDRKIPFQFVALPLSKHL